MLTVAAGVMGAFNRRMRNPCTREMLADLRSALGVPGKPDSYWVVVEVLGRSTLIF